MAGLVSEAGKSSLAPYRKKFFRIGINLSVDTNKTGMFGAFSALSGPGQYQSR